MNHKEIVVSVCMITYNHEPFIRQAIEGVLMQRTAFPIELIIGEDCSTDGTRAICIEYQKQYPDIIKLQLPEQNRGMQNNFLSVLNTASGKYIAFCEGDDYWTDGHKLQRQVDFMEIHSDYGLVHTRFNRYYQTSNTYSLMPLYSDNDNTFERLLFDDIIGTLSVLVKRDLCLQAVNSGICNMDFKMGDYPLWLLIAKNSKIGYISDCTAVYRYLPDSASHSHDELKQFEFYKSTMAVQAFFSKDTQYEKSVKKHQQNKLFKMFVYNYRQFNRKLNMAIFAAIDRKYISVWKYCLCRIMIRL